MQSRSRRTARSQQGLRVPAAGAQLVTDPRHRKRSLAGHVVEAGSQLVGYGAWVIDAFPHLHELPSGAQLINDTSRDAET